MTRLIDADALLEAIGKSSIIAYHKNIVDQCAAYIKKYQSMTGFGYEVDQANKRLRIHKQYMDVITELITNAPTVEREGWVSVDDRFPELGQWYLIFVKDKFSTMAFLDTHTETGETLWLAHNNNFQGEWENVTHWQHLPSAPNE